MKFYRAALCSLLAGAALVTATVRFAPDSMGRDFLMQRATGKFTVADRVQEFGPQVEARWQPYFARARVAYPPTKIILLGLKQEKRLEIYADDNGKWKWVRSLPILKASGHAGPKLREGDYQVPEGFYPVEALNPNSSFHLALRVGYPNAADRQIAAREGRADLGGDIMIHGGAASIGCLAMGDQVAEDLFVLAAQVGRENVQIALAPRDFRVEKLQADASRPAWLEARYRKLDELMKTLPLEHQ